MTDPDRPQPAPYVLDSAARADLEFDRLRTIEQVYDPGTEEILTRVNPAPGWSCLEVGAGAGSIARLLASLAGETGRVVATDSDPRFLRNIAHPGVEVIEHDITAGPLPPGSWDLIHARSVLEHLPDPESVLARLIPSLAPHGQLFAEAIDVSRETLAIAAKHAPDRRAATAFLEFATAVHRLMTLAGAHPELGSTLPVLLAAQGLEGITHQRRHPLVSGGKRGFYALTLARLAPSFQDHGLLDTADRRLSSLFDDPSMVFPALPIGAAHGHTPAVGRRQRRT
ncbi:methyltransferase domain-containing protein [Kitasatospora sp. NPDC088264]|uniref:class I SAM-dependent methyltransferase n=1 Tax=unclassified Kitasatospora TaxID=2633591 RepID=UPI00341F99D8